MTRRSEHRSASADNTSLHRERFWLGRNAKDPADAASATFVPKGSRQDRKDIVTSELPAIGKIGWIQETLLEQMRRFGYDL